MNSGLVESIDYGDHSLLSRIAQLPGSAEERRRENKSQQKQPQVMRSKRHIEQAVVARHRSGPDLRPFASAVHFIRVGWPGKGKDSSVALAVVLSMTFHVGSLDW